MRLDWAVPCRFAEAPGDGTMTIAGGGLDTFWVDEAQLPGDVGFFIAIRVAGTEDDFAGQHELAIRLVKPDPTEEEEDILRVGFEAMEMPPLKKPGFEAGLLVPALITFEASELGTYDLQIFIDENRERAIPVSIRSASELQT